MIRRRAVELTPETFMQLICGQETTVGANIFLDWTIHRAGNMTGHLIEWFDFASKTRLISRIDQQASAVFDNIFNELGAYPQTVVPL